MLTPQEVMVYLTEPRTIPVSDTEFAKANPGMVTEQNIIRDGKFVYEHHTEQIDVVSGCRFFAKLTAAAGIAQPDPVDLATTRYWYRAITRDQFRYLKKHGELQEEDSFGCVGGRGRCVRPQQFSRGRFNPFRNAIPYSNSLDQVTLCLNRATELLRKARGDLDYILGRPAPRFLRRTKMERKRNACRAPAPSGSLIATTRIR